MDLFQLWGKIGIKTQDAMNELNKFEGKVGAVAQGVGNGATAMGSKFQSVGQSVSAAGDKMVGAGKKASLAVSAPILGVGAAALKTVTDFDDVMGTVAGVTGATGVEFDKLRDKAKELGATTRYKASEAAEGMQYLGMAGWDTNKILEGMPHMLNLASAGGLDLGRAADIASDTMSAFGINAKDAGHMADVFAKAASSTNTSVDMLGETMKYAAPVAATFGASLEETTALASLMADKGIKASMAGTAIRGGLTRLADPAKGATYWLDKMNTTLVNSDGSMKDMNTIIREMSTGMSTLTEEQKLQAAKSIFGQEAMAGWLAVLDTGPDKFDAMTDSLEKSSAGMGAAAEIAAKREDNIGGAFREMFSAIEGVAIEIGDVLVPTVKKAAVAINKLATWFTKLSPATKKTVVVIGAMVAAFGPLMIAMGFMMKTTGFVLKSVGSMFKMFGKGPKVLGAAAKAMTGFGNASKGASAAAAVAGPCGPTKGGKAKKGKKGRGVVAPCPPVPCAGAPGGKPAKGAKGAKAGVAAATAATMAPVPSGKPEKAPKAAKAPKGGLLKGAAKGVGNSLKGIGGMVARFGAGLLPMLMNPVSLAIVAVVAAVAGAVYLVVKHWDAIKTGAVKAFTAIGDFFKKWGPNILIALTGPLGMIVAFFVKNWDAVKSATSNFLQAVKTIFSTGLSAITSAISSALSGIGAWFTNTWNNVKMITQAALTVLGSIVRVSFNAVLGFLRTALSTIVNIVRNGWNAVKSVTMSILNALKGVIVSIWRSIRSFISSVMSGIRSIITTVWNSIKSFLSKIMGTIKSIISSAWNSIKSIVSNAVNAVKRVVVSAFNSIKNFIRSTMSSIRSLVTGAFNAMKNAASRAGAGIKNAMVSAFNVVKNIAKKSYGWGKDIMSGLARGLTNGIKNVVKTVGKVASTLSETFKKLLGIHSPSRVFKGFGLNIGQGLVQGIKKTDTMIKKASQGMNNSIIRPDTTIERPKFSKSSKTSGKGSIYNTEGVSSSDTRSGSQAIYKTPPNDGVTIQNATFEIKIEKVHTDEDVLKLRRAIQTVVSDDLFGMAVRNV